MNAQADMGRNCKHSPNARAQIEEKYLSAPNVIGVIVGR